MNSRQRLSLRLRSLVPARYRHFVKQQIERYSDVARRSFYSDYGEDAFLQSYFRQQVYGAYPGLPLYMYQKMVLPGFYVDVGAYSPKLFSTTYWFYRNGWRGINIDATPGTAERFRKVRPRDVNIEMAVSNQQGQLIFYCWDNPSPLNTLSSERAKQLSQELGREPEHITVPVRKLSTLLDQYLPRGQKISFLSVDVEKHDLEVLRSNNWEKYRPELVLVESHLPRVSQIVGSDITHLLSEVGYEIYAWIKPTVVYRQSDLQDPLIA